MTLIYVLNMPFFIFATRFKLFRVSFGCHTFYQSYFVVEGSLFDDPKNVKILIQRKQCLKTL